MPGELVLVVVAGEVAVEHLLELHEQAVVAAVVAEPDRAEHELVVVGHRHVVTAGAAAGGGTSGGGRSLSTWRRYVAIAFTCCFSHRTLTRWPPARAVRKNTREPGSPTTSAVNSSTSSNS